MPDHYGRYENRDLFGNWNSNNQVFGNDNTPDESLSDEPDAIDILMERIDREDATIDTDSPRYRVAMTQDVPERSVNNVSLIDSYARAAFYRMHVQNILQSLTGGDTLLSRVDLEDAATRSFISDLNDTELLIFNEVAGHNSLNQTAIIKSPAAIRQFTKKMVGPNVDPIVKKLHKSDSKEFLNKVTRNSNLSREISNSIIGIL